MTIQEKATEVINRIDPDMVQCEECKLYFRVNEIKQFITPATKNKHHYCSECLELFEGDNNEWQRSI